MENIFWRENSNLYLKDPDLIRLTIHNSEERNINQPDEDMLDFKGIKPTA